MTRSAAREIAIHCSYSLGFSNQSPEEFLEERMDRVHFQRWGEESPLYQDYPNDKQMQYIREVVLGVAEHGPELDQYIAQYSKNWNFARIPLTAAAIMRWQCTRFSICQRFPPPPPSTTRWRSPKNMRTKK